jgi:hypothetical protein
VCINISIAFYLDILRKLTYVRSRTHSRLHASVGTRNKGKKENEEEVQGYLLLFLKTSTTITRIATMNASIAASSPVRIPEVLGSTCSRGVVLGTAVGVEEGFCLDVEGEAVVVAEDGVSVGTIVGSCVGVWVGFAVGADVGAGVGVSVWTGVC